MTGRPAEQLGEAALEAATAHSDERTLALTPARDRPRERLIARGPRVLSDTELVAVLLGTGTKRRDVLAVASDLAARLPRAADEDDVNVDRLCETLGVGTTQACRVAAALELGRRRAARDDDDDRPSISSPADVYHLARDIRRLRREHFLVFYLDARNRVGRSEVVSIGTLNASLVHPREVFGPAVRDPAASIVLSHNHPSGDTSPSDDDVAITRRLISAGEILGIAVLDHVIVGARGFMSFREAHLL